MKKTIVCVFVIAVLSVGLAWFLPSNNGNYEPADAETSYAPSTNDVPLQEIGRIISFSQMEELEFQQCIEMRYMRFNSFYGGLNTFLINNTTYYYDQGSLTLFRKEADHWRQMQFQPAPSMGSLFRPNSYHWESRGLFGRNLPDGEYAIIREYYRIDGHYRYPLRITGRFTVPPSFIPSHPSVPHVISEYDMKYFETLQHSVEMQALGSDRSRIINVGLINNTEYKYVFYDFIYLYEKYLGNWRQVLFSSNVWNRSTFSSFFLYSREQHTQTYFVREKFRHIVTLPPGKYAIIKHITPYGACASYSFPVVARFTIP